MRQKIKARLNALFPGVNLSNERTDAIADALGKLINEDSEDSVIDEALMAYDGAFSFADMARADDRKRAEERRKKAEGLRKKFEPKKTEKPDAEDSTEINSEDEEAPAWVKTLLESNRALAERVAAFEKGQIRESRATQLRKALREAGAPDAYIERAVKNFGKMNFETDDEFNEHLTEEINDAKQFAQATADESLSRFGRPIFSRTEANQVSSETLAYIKAKSEGVNPASKFVGKPINPSSKTA